MGRGFNQSGNENEMAGVADKTATFWRLDGQKRLVGSLPPSGLFNRMKLDVLQEVEERIISSQTQNTGLPTSHPKEPSLTP